MANETSPSIVLTEAQAIEKAATDIAAAAVKLEKALVPPGTIEQKAADASPANVVLPENAQSPPQAQPSVPKLQAIPMPAKPAARGQRNDWRTRAAVRAVARNFLQMPKK
jgi:hypothetical protein